jgi:hypothetical protein
MENVTFFNEFVEIRGAEPVLQLIVLAIRRGKGAVVPV